MRSVFLTGCIGLVYCAFGPYPPLDRTLVVCFLLPGFIAGALFLRDRKGRSVTLATLAVASAPYFLAALFWANGALDPSQELRYPAPALRP